MQKIKNRYPYQEMVLRYMEFYGSILLHADCGLGKTFIATELAVPRVEDKPVLYLTRKRAKLQLAKFMATQYPDVKVVVPKKGYFTPAIAKPGNFIITHYEALRSMEDVLIHGKMEFSVVIGDESHLFKNPSTKRSINALRASRLADLTLAMSGTPSHKQFIIDEETNYALPDPTDTWNQLKFAHRDKATGDKKLPTYVKWKSRHLKYKSEFIPGINRYVPKVVGLEWPEWYAADLAPTYYRISKTALGHVPPTTVPVYVEPLKKQALYYKNLEKRAKEDIIVNLGDIGGESHLILNVLSLYIHLQKAASLPAILNANIESVKLKWLEEFIEDNLFEKGIIFTRFIDTADYIYKFLTHKYPNLDIAISAGKQQTVKAGVEHDIVIGTIAGLNSAYDAYWSNYLIFFEMDWKLIDMAQAKDRIDRGFSEFENHKTIYYLLMEDSIDELMWRNVSENWPVEKLKDAIRYWVTS